MATWLASATDNLVGKILAMPVVFYCLDLITLFKKEEKNEDRGGSGRRERSRS